MAVLVAGTGFALAGSRPMAAIVLAQAANGVLLPQGNKVRRVTALEKFRKPLGWTSRLVPAADTMTLIEFPPTAMRLRW